MSFFVALFYALTVEPNVGNYYSITNYLFYWYVVTTILMLLVVSGIPLSGRFHERAAGISKFEHYKPYVILSFADMAFLLIVRLPLIVGGYQLRSAFIENAARVEHKIIVGLILLIIGVLLYKVPIKVFDTAEKFIESRRRCSPYS